MHRSRPLLGGLTPRITGSKKQSEERAVLFAVRVDVIVMHLWLLWWGLFLGLSPSLLGGW